MIPQNRSRNTSPILGVVGLVLFLVVAYYLLKISFGVLMTIAPILFILTLFIDYTVVTDYAKWVVRLFKTKWYYGVGAGIMTFIGFYFVIAFLFGKAMLKKKFAGANMGPMGKVFDQKSNDRGFTEYEEIDSEIVIDDVELESEELDLGEIEDNFNTLDKDDPYENLFGNEK